MTTAYDGNARNVIRHIREEAAVMVRRVNQGCTGAEPWFPAKVAEVTAALVCRLIAELMFGLGRLDLARKIERAAELEGAVTWQD
jgi:hypothetical protein